MANVIIFGMCDTAQLAHYYLENDSSHEVVAFSLHEKFIEEKEFNGLPVVPFEDVEKLYPPTEFKFFAPMTGKKMNQLREKIYLEVKDKGYDLISYVSSKASIFNTVIGENCFILENNTIQPYVNIGNNVILWSGNHIGHHGKIKDHVFFTSQVVMSGHCIVHSHCWLGVNSTLRDFCELAKGTFVAMGACVTAKTTEEYGIYVGNPATRKGKLPSYKFY